MKKLSLVLLAGLAIAGCDDKDGDTADTSTTDGGSTDGGGSGGDTEVACAWDGSDNFSIDIINGDGAGYDLGFAEVDASSSDPWTGEDCGYVGYTTGDGTLYEICHDMASTGGSLVHVDTVEEITAGVSTIHAGAIENAYYLYEIGTGTCWTWGVTAAYFDDCVDATGVVSCSGD